VPKSTQSCDGGMVKAVLRLRIAATSTSEHVSGSHRSHFADIPRGWFKA